MILTISFLIQFRYLILLLRVLEFNQWLSHDVKYHLEEPSKIGMESQWRWHIYICHTSVYHISTTKYKSQYSVPVFASEQFQALFHSRFQVLFIFPSQYLYAIGLSSLFSFRRCVPPTLRSTPKLRDSHGQWLNGLSD